MPGTLNDELTAQISRVNNVNNNPLATFSYKVAAYQADTPEAAAGHSDYDPARDNNIPEATYTALDTNQTVLSEGFRSQASSITRNLMNHFFGRTSFNLNKVISVVYNALTSIKNFIGQPNGIAELDAQGRIPYSQLPESAMEFKGFWAANTNTPTLHDGIGTNGDMYVVSVAGTQDLGSGSIVFLVNDRVIYSGTTHTWGRIPAGDVTSVNNIQPVDGNVTVPVFTGATQNGNGAQGLVPAPSAGDQPKFLCADGTWKAAAAAAIDAVYPIGSLYWTSKDPLNGGDPNVLFPGTVWARLKDAFVWAAGDNDTVTPADPQDATTTTKQGGNTSVTIGSGNLPPHTHGLNGTGASTSSTGGWSLSIRRFSAAASSDVIYSSGSSTGLSFDSTGGGTSGNRFSRESTTDANYSRITKNDHAHSLSGNTTNGGFANTALNIKNPYINRYCWERTA